MRGHLVESAQRAHLNGTVRECIIEMCNPRAAWEPCVWWREPDFIIASAGDGMSPERGRQTEMQRLGEREREKEGRRRDTILTVWMIHHMIVLDRAVLWLPIPHSPTVLHFTSPAGLIYYTQQNCYRLDLLPLLLLLLPISFQTFSQGNIPRKCVYLLLFFIILFFSPHIFTLNLRAGCWAK